MGSLTAAGGDRLGAFLMITETLAGSSSTLALLFTLLLLLVVVVILTGSCMDLTAWAAVMEPTRDLDLSAAPAASAEVASASSSCSDHLLW